MGLLTDFVIADPAEAERVCASDPTDGRFAWFQAKGMDIPRVGHLYAALLGQPYAPSLVPFTVLAVGDDEGPVVYALPDDLIRRLAALDPAADGEVARRWAATDPLTSEESNRRVIDGLRGLCAEAARRGKAVLLSVAL